MENRRFIRSIASKATGRFITESDDERFVALIAFHEAVRSYDDSKGSFRSFAALVIKRRLVDYMASQARHQLEIYVEPESMDGNVEEETASPFQLEVRSKSAEISEMQDGAAIRDEIEAVQQIELLENAGEIKADTKDSDDKKTSDSEEKRDSAAENKADAGSSSNKNDTKTEENTDSRQKQQRKNSQDSQSARDAQSSQNQKESGQDSADSQADRSNNAQQGNADGENNQRLGGSTEDNTGKPYTTE